jgi:hypothetical protein
VSELASSLPVERVDWETFWRQKGGLRPGQHVSVFGPTGYGKTYSLIWFCEDFPGNSILVITKGRDEIVQRLVKERGWILTHQLDDIFTDAGKPGRLLRKSWGDRWEKREHPPQRIVFKPEPQSKGVRNRADFLAGQFEEFLDRAYEYCLHGGECFVGVDETMFAAMELDMSKAFVVIWNEGRSMGLSLGAAMQRPAWIPKSSKSAPMYVIVFDTSEPDDLLELAKLLGYQKAAELRAQLDQLGEHEHLLGLTRTRPRQIVRSRVVIRKRRGEDTAGDGRDGTQGTAKRMAT